MGILIYGGSFNPLHIGHMRIAIGARELLADFVDRVDFVPVGIPPHKNAASLLPFKLRAAIIKSVLEAYPDMRCNEDEGAIEGPAYTYETLRRYHRAIPGGDFYFLLGSQDYELLPTWRMGLDLISLTNLVIVPRGEFSARKFMEMTANLWNNDVIDIKDSGAFDFGGGLCIAMPTGQKIFYLPLPVLEISASEIRGLWREGRNIDFLVPAQTREILRQNIDIVRAYWRESKCLA